MKKTLIGTGILSWMPTERRTDRYGMVGLCSKNSQDKLLYSEPKVDGNAIFLNLGKEGKLVAKVIEARESTHIGDLFHGYYPEQPEVGDEIELGEGIFFSEEPGDDWKCYVGLRPIGEIKNEKGHWMNPVSLYRAHEQTVELYFVTN